MSWGVPSETKVPLNTGLPVNPEMREEMSTSPKGSFL